jgi:hypothetical protein
LKIDWCSILFTSRGLSTLKSCFVGHCDLGIITSGGDLSLARGQACDGSRILWDIYDLVCLIGVRLIFLLGFCSDGGWLLAWGVAW